MKVDTLTVCITSEKPERLMEFYRDVVGLPPKPDFGEARSTPAGRPS